MKTVFWTILKVLAMLFVFLSCISSIQRMAMVASMTGNYVFLGGTILLDLGFMYWAYRVICKPIKPKV